MPDQPRYYGMMLWGNHNICNHLICERNMDGLRQWNVHWHMNIDKVCEGLQISH
jgi:hypothetical protein